MVYQGPLPDLTSRGVARVRVAIREIDTAIAAGRQMGWTVNRDGEDMIVEGVPARDVNRALAGRSLYAHGIAEESRSLEDVFLELTEGDSGG
jgi:hypothetical protein